MLSVRRLFYVIVMVLGICGMFLLSNINETDTAMLSMEQNGDQEVGKGKKILRGQSIVKSEEVQFYILGDENKELYGDIYRNVCGLMKDLKVSWKKRACIGEEELENHRAVFIFCDDTLHSYVDLRCLTEFIEAGGKVILAAGLAEGYEDSYSQPVFGIVEKNIKESYPKLRFQKGFFPVQEAVMTYDGFHASTWLTIRKDAKVYVEDAEHQVPIVYSYSYGKGKTLIINSTLLQDRRMLGFLTAGIGCLLETFVYPVVGVECVTLENFPEITSIDDKVCMNFYGRNTEAFVRDVISPVLQGMAVRNQIPYIIMCDRERTNYDAESGDCVILGSDLVSENRMEKFQWETSGTDLDSGNMLTIASSVGGYGIVSHTFDINQFLSVDGKGASWERVKYQLEVFEKRVLEPTDFLEKVQVEEANSGLKSYQEINYFWKKLENGIEITAGNMLEGQPFFVRCPKQIDNAEGAEIIKLENNYYFLHMNTCRVVLTFK